MYDAVTIALERSARRAFGFGNQPAAANLGQRGIRRRAQTHELTSLPARTTYWGMNDTVTMTSNAARRIKEILASEPDKRALRVAVNGGGCSGFQYEFALEAKRNEDDTVIEKDGATVVIDSTSLLYMGGSEIDFADDLIGQAFKVKNPNATAS